MKSGERLAAAIAAAILAMAPQAVALEPEDPEQSVASADLEISIAAAYDPAVAGRVQIYDVEIVNRGPAIAHDVLFDYEPVAQAWLAGVRRTQASCAVTGRSLVCDLGALAVGQTARLSVGIYVDSRFDGPLRASALISSTTADPDESNNDATAETSTIPARAATAVPKADGSDELVVSVKESDTTIGLVFLDPSGEERRASVSSPGYRAVALASIVSAQGRDAVVALAFGFDGSAVLDVIDATDAQSVARYPLREGLVPLDLVSIPTGRQPAPSSERRARAPMSAVAVLAFDPSTLETCVLVVDARTGTEQSKLCTPGTTEGAFPVGLALLGDGSRLALLTSSLTRTTLHFTTPSADNWEGSLALSGEGLPLDLQASEREFLVLDRGADGGGITRARLADSASFTSTRDLGHALPEALVPLAPASEETPELLAVAGRAAKAPWLELLPRSGTAHGLGEGREGDVCLGLVELQQAEDSRSSHIAVIYEHPGEPTEVAVFDLDRLERTATYVLP